MARPIQYEVLGVLPPGGVGQTSLAMMRGPGNFRRVVVLRPIGDWPLVPVASVHPSLLTPLAIEEVNGTVQAVWDFVPGATLREIGEIYRRQSQLPPLGLVVRAIVDAARALHVAHSDEDLLRGPQGYAHGALSDRAVLMGFDGVTRVLDFGVREKNRFSAPEASGAGPIDARSDVFSLAAVLHAALTGFDQSYAQVLAKTPSSAEFPPPSTVHPDASQQLDAVVMRALFPARESRSPSALELADDLERIVGAAMPRAAACGVRLKQLFEPRVEALRALLSRTQPGPSAARPSGPRRPRPSGPRAPPPVARPSPPEVGEPHLEPSLGDDDPPTQVQAVPSQLMMAARPTGEQMRMLAAKTTPGQVPWATHENGDLEGHDLSPADEPASITDEPTRLGVRAIVAPPPEPDDGLVEPELVQSIDIEPPSPSPPSLAEYGDVPTAPRRASGEKARLGGHSAAERARARGQELVSTAELEAAEADELRRPIEEPDARGRPAGPHPQLDIDTGEVPTASRPKQKGDQPPRGKGGRVVIALLLALIAGGAAISKLRPELVAKLRARIDKQLLPAEAQEDEPIAAGEDAGEAAPMEMPEADGGEPALGSSPDGGESAAAEDELDGGLEEEDDAGLATDAGAHRAAAKKKKRRHH